MLLMIPQSQAIAWLVIKAAYSEPRKRVREVGSVTYDNGKRNDFREKLRKACLYK